jgi:dUTP pyrophosphatase
MKILKCRNVKTPSRGTSKSAGIDFYVPNDIDAISLEPGQDALIPSGIKVNVPKGHALIAFNKSGIATKSKLIKGAEVVDEDYTGEIHIHVFNAGRGLSVITPGQKLIQFILIPVNYEGVEEVVELDSIETERGEGGFGSTGTH